MRITIKRKKRSDFMGSVTTVTTTVIEDAEESDVLRLLGGSRLYAYTAFPGRADTRAIEVNEAMRAAGRAVFLAPERLAALRDTLDEVYRAMEREARRPLKHVRGSADHDGGQWRCPLLVSGAATKAFRRRCPPKLQRLGDRGRERRSDAVTSAYSRALAVTRRVDRPC